MLHCVSKDGFEIHFVRSMFYAKEEKADFKLENESYPNIRHFFQIYTYIFTKLRTGVHTLT